MLKYMLSPMQLDSDLGKAIDRVAEIRSAMGGRAVSTPSAARHAMFLGCKAFMAQPDVVAFLASAETGMRVLE